MGDPEQLRPNDPATPNPTVALDRLDLEAMARRVVELIHEDVRPPASRRLVDAATLAAELGVKRSWVYEHRDQLAPVRLGTGSKARLRFDVQVARQILRAWSSTRTASEPPATDLKLPRRRRSLRGNSPPAGAVLSVRSRETK
jgi:hypothetical protein